MYLHINFRTVGLILMMLFVSRGVQCTGNMHPDWITFRNGNWSVFVSDFEEWLNYSGCILQVAITKQLLYDRNVHDVSNCTASLTYFVFSAHIQ